MALIPGLTTLEGDGARDTPVRPGTIHLKGASDQGILVFLSGLNNLSFSLPFVSCFNNKSFFVAGTGIRGIDLCTLTDFKSHQQFWTIHINRTN